MKEKIDINLAIFKQNIASVPHGRLEALSVAKKVVKVFGDYLYPVTTDNNFNCTLNTENLPITWCLHVRIKLLLRGL